MRASRVGSGKDVQRYVMNGLTVAKYVVSTVLTICAIGFVSFGIITGKAALSGHPAMHIAILVFVLTLLAYLEGLQVAILQLEGHDESAWQESHPRASALHKLANHGNNVQRFLVGRQFYVVFVVFLCSQVTTFPDIKRPDAFPYPLWFALIETALPGALIVLAFGQLMPQLIAARDAVCFCNIPGAIWVLRMTLCLEALGLTHFSWLLTSVVMRIFGVAGGAKSSTDVQDPEKGLQDTSPPAGAMEGLMEIAQKWKSLASMEELSHLCAHLGAEPCVDSDMTNAGMKPSGVADPASELRYKDTPQAQTFPTPKQIAQYLSDAGQSVPCFLLPPAHPQHVPPHIVAFGLMSGLVQQRELTKRDRAQSDCSTMEATSNSGGSNPSAGGSPEMPPSADPWNQVKAISQESV